MSRKSNEKPAATPTPPASISNGEPATYQVRVRTIFGEAVLTVPASSANEARERVIGDFAAGVTIEES